MENQEHIITSIGRSVLKVDQDELILNVEVCSEYPTNEQANKAVSDTLEKIRNILKELGMEEINAVLSTVNVTQLTRSLYDKHDHCIGEEVYAYRMRLDILLKMQVAHPSFNQLIELIGQRLQNAEIGISYNLKDSRKAKLEALKDAVKDSKAKAELIVKALNYKLDTICEITESCSCSSEKKESRLFGGSNIGGFCCSSGNDNITPSSVEVTAVVTIKWNIVEA